MRKVFVYVGSVLLFSSIAVSLFWLVLVTAAVLAASLAGGGTSQDLPLPIRMLIWGQNLSVRLLPFVFLLGFVERALRDGLVRLFPGPLHRGLDSRASRARRAASSAGALALASGLWAALVDGSVAADALAADALVALPAFLPIFVLSFAVQTLDAAEPAPHTGGWDFAARRFLPGIGVGVTLLLLIGPLFVTVGQVMDQRAASGAGTAGLVVAVLGALALALCLIAYTGSRVTALPARWLRAVGGASIAVVVLCAVTFVAADRWGARQLEARQSEWTALVQAERARLAARPPRPVVEGQPLDENAADRYRPLLLSMKAAIDADRRLIDLLSPAATARPMAAVADPATGAARRATVEKAAPVLEQQGQALATLRQSLRATRLDWRWELERGWSMELPPLLGFQVLKNLLVVSGHQSALAGDARAAATSYLEAVRLGADLGDEPVLIVNLVGIAAAQAGLESLGEQATSERMSPKLAGEAAETLARLEPILPHVISGYRGQRLDLLGMSRLGLPPITHWMPEHLGRIVVAQFVLPDRALIAHAIGEAAPMLQELEEIAPLGDDPEASRRASLVYARFASAINPVTAGLGKVYHAHQSAVCLRARHALTASALRIEQQRTRAGTYRADLAGLVAQDPFAPKGTALRWSVAKSGRGYKLWSVGQDHRDDGGDATGDRDLVLERLDRSQ